MKTLNTYWILALIMIAASCTSKREYAYNFSYQKHSKSIQKDIEVDLSALDLTIDEETLMAGDMILPEVVLHVADKSEEKVMLPNGIELKEKNTYTRAEKQQIRSDYRAAKKEYKAAVKSGDEIKAAEAANNVSGYLRTGIILGAAGLVLLIIGGSQLVTAVGSILLIAGVVFILLDVL